MQLLIYVCVFLFVALITVCLVGMVSRNGTRWSEEIQLFDRLLEQELQKRKRQEVVSLPKKVPKIIWRIWCNDEPKGTCGGRPASYGPWEITEAYTSPLGWEQKIFVEGKNWVHANSFLRDNFKSNPDVLRAFQLINPEYGAAKADFLRYALMYINGGMYLDMKSCISGNIPSIPENKDIVTFHWGSKFQPQTHLFKGGEYVNWFLYARPRSAIMKEIIDAVVRNVLELHHRPYRSYQFNISEEASTPTGVSRKGLVLVTTGPVMFSRIIRNELKKENNKVLVLKKPIAKYMCQPDSSVSTGHYSIARGPLVFPNKNGLYIPDALHIFEGETNASKGFDIKRHSMKDCEEFVKIFYPGSFMEYENLSQMQKIDTVKMLILYVHGGSIGSWGVKPDLTVPHTWYTKLNGNDIQSDLLCTPPRNPILLDYTRDLIDNGLRPRGDLSTYISRAVDTGRVKPGLNLMENGWFANVLQKNRELRESFTLHNPGNSNYHIYVINMRRSKDRRAKMIQQLRNCPIPWTIVDAVDGRSKLPPGHIPIKSQLKPGEIGVFLSHLKAYKIFLENRDAKKAIIMEDDCELPPGWWRNVTDVCDEYIPQVVDFVHLDKKLFNFYERVGDSGDPQDLAWANATFPGKQHRSLRPREVIRDHIIETGPELGLVAYCINRRAAKVLVNSLSAINMPIDVQIHLPAVRQKLRWGKLKNNQIDHGHFPSTISK